MKTKRILCLMIILAIIFPATLVLAEETLTEKVGIAQDLSSHKIIKLDSQKETLQPTLLENTQVVNYGDSIGVFSCPQDSQYYITAASLRSVLLGSTVLGAPGQLTSNGYDLNYYLPQANEPASSDTVVVAGGFVRATKDGEEPIDISITDYMELAVYDGPEIGNDWTNSADGTYRERNVVSLAGKGADDGALRFTVNPGISISGNNPTRSDTQKINTLNTPKSVITIEFSVRVTGDLVANVDMDNGSNIMRLSSDGILTYYSYNAGQKYIDVDVCNDASVWHNFAMTYDYAGNRLRYYFDGKPLPQSGNLTSQVLTQLRFGPRSLAYTEGGTVSFDNLRISRGYYTPYENIVVSSTGDAVIVSGKEILYDPARVGNINELMNLLDTDADSYSLFKDDSYSSLEENLSTGNILVFYDEENDAYSYYGLQAWKLDIENVEFINNGTKISAKTNLSYRGRDGVKATLVLVLIDEEGRISSVTSSQEGIISGDCELTTSEIEKGTCTAKAFFITDLTSRLGINNKIYSEEE